MKKTITLFTAALFFLMVSCEDAFLDLDDLDSITESVYFDNPQDFEYAANNFYRTLHSPQGTDGDGFSDISDYGTELNAWVQDYGQGINFPQSIDIYWNNGYTNLRGVNILLKKADEYVADGGNASDISESVAAAYFFRAYQHFRLLKRFGGVPIMIEVTNVDSEVLFAPRNSRYEVVEQILVDLDLAISGLPETATGTELGKISSVAALAYKSRVLLFEGTWEKHVGTVTDFEGSGSENNSASYISQAAIAAKSVMDSGHYQIWNQNADPNMDNNSYRWLFTLEGADSNPGGYDKSSNKEFIIQTIFDFATAQQMDAMFTHSVGGRNAPTQTALDMYSCLDGLPIYKSSQFLGYYHQSDQFINRDLRMWANFGSKVIEEGSVPINPISNINNSNLDNQKFRTWNLYRAEGTEAYNYAHLRYAEILLTYAEAVYESTGTISDADLNLSVNIIRDRAGIAHLTNELVATNGLDMLEEIRRERTVELYMEDNNHWNDIRRWDTAEELLNADLIGYVIEGTEYATNEELFDPVTSAIYGFKDDYQSGVGPVKALIIDPVSTRIYSHKNYLWPLPLNEIIINSALVQNPGWY
ncbi:RagB/SusD family nutrient uptake outer membrane protein [Flavicella sp.]|uniref:RagB/SusD family nutrient uptake outer membrane protein n=1 Tax=Flavicella sp. TaxID=2957742 RepID=UPI0030170028